MRKQKNPLVLSLSIVALALSIFAVVQVYITNTNSGSSDEDFVEKVYDVIDDYVAENSGRKGPKSAKVEDLIDDDAVKGDKNAPVTIVEFSDYECPFCGKYYNTTLKEITKNYIDTGKVKYIFRDLPLEMHHKAIPAANAAECVREQGGDEMYFAYHDTLFEHQSNVQVKTMEELEAHVKKYIVDLKKYAADLDIDQDQFNKCFDSGKYHTEINKDMKDAQELGIKGTPAFYIEGEPIVGAVPYSVFEAAIEEALSKK